MNILHINALQTGGAAICARRICDALRVQGIDSRILTTEGMPDDYIYIAQQDDKKKDWWYSNKLLGRIKHLLMRTPWYWDEEKMEIELRRIQETTQERPYIHLPYSFFQSISHHSLIDWADIIHLHWVSGMVDYPTFFNDIEKPIVWTLHDSHPAIGVLHYQSELLPLPETYQRLDKECIKIKRKAIRFAKSKPHIVAISQKMQEIISNSKILSDMPVTLIHNGVDTNVFHPYNKELSRKELNIPLDAIVILFSSYQLNDTRKGLDRVIESINLLNNTQIHLVCVGDANGYEIPSNSPEITKTGLVTDQNKLAKIYSAADFFIQASYEESFGQTPLEAMSCGTPVISTPCGVSSELITDFNGVICSGYDEQALSNGIIKALSQTYDSNVIRQYVIENYSYDVIAHLYIQLYEKVMFNN